MKKHSKNCLIFLCTCAPQFEAVSDDGPECCRDRYDCDCLDCQTDREAALDREFDEKVALAYI